MQERPLDLFYMEPKSGIQKPKSGIQKFKSDHIDWARDQDLHPIKYNSVTDGLYCHQLVPVRGPTFV